VVWWLWGQEIQEYVGEKTRGLRTKAEEGLRVVEEQAEKVLDRGGAALHRADDARADESGCAPWAVFLHGTKEHVTEALRAGQDAIHPAPAARKA
jgi:hypothetical protein